MNNEKVIIDKDDYHKILDMVDILLEYYDDDAEKVEDIKDLLEKANDLDEIESTKEYVIKIVKEFCSSQGYQVWIEIVADEPSGTGIFIEDGEIKDEN